MTLPECAWCSRSAIATVHAQWTLFDRKDAYACLKHVEHAFSRYWNTAIEDQPPIDVWVTYWDVDDDALARADSP